MRRSKNHSDQEDAASSHTGRRTVLYVEDNNANVLFMKDLLSTLENVELLTAATAEAGIDLARIHLPDVIVMDINLPGISGFEALRELRTTPATAGIPVVALTAALERDRRAGEAAGFHRYLTKPVNVDELETVLLELFESKTSQ
jgi:CheY-like chemotaxis protein